MDRSAELTSRFGQIDSDSNGKLERTELEAVFGEYAGQFLQFCDAGEKDGVLTCDEFVAGITKDCDDMPDEQFQADWLDRMSTCIVNAKPLSGGAVEGPPVLSKPTNVDQWFEENKDLFSPPVCNKLMHKKQLNVMFVGGPNSRTDFHLDLGSEFFFQLRGNMELPTIQQGVRKLVKINQGEVFLLPSRVPHSPQRPEEGSFGMVIEREREDGEMDGLRWYTDFETCEQVLWEKYFTCHDLGRDLVPVVKEYKASEEASSMQPSARSICTAPPFPQDMDTCVPDPFNFWDWLSANEEALTRGAALNLFEGHPDKEFEVVVTGGGTGGPTRFEYETWVYQVRGSAVVVLVGQEMELGEGSCVVVPAGDEYEILRSAGSVGMVVTQDPRGNRQ